MRYDLGLCVYSATLLFEAVENSLQEVNSNMFLRLALLFSIIV